VKGETGYRFTLHGLYSRFTIHGSIMKNIAIFIAFLKKLYESRYMVRMMAIRDLKAVYVGSLFGFFWAVINPLAQLAIYGVVFGVLLKSRPDPVYGTDSFFLFLLCGLVPWQFFAQTVNASTNTLLSHANLVKKAVGFNSEILPVITVLSNLITHFIGVVLLLAIVFIVTGKLSPMTPVILLYLFFIVIFSVGIGWIVSSINVYLRDVQQVMGLIMLGWMFLTPIFYSVSIVPAKMMPIVRLNPLYYMVEGYRFAILTGKLLPAADIATMAVVSFLTFGIGGLLFRRLKPGFGEVL
jgi:ABC-type polysaccharide/polyol phosphate export permease